MQINNQWVLVTGGARGLGEAITRALLREGANVVVNYFSSESRAKALAEEFSGRVVALQADVTKPQEVKHMFDEAKRITGQPILSVINNALIDFKFDGDARPQFEDLPWERVQQQIEGAVRGAMNVIQAALADMKAHKFGRVVNIGTNLFQNPVVPYHDYTAAKAALLSLTRTAANDLGQFGITVNMLSGGLLRTTDASAATPDFVFDLIAQNTPLREVTTPEAFADSVLFFVSPWSRAVTGQNLIVDGGLVKG